MEPVTEKEFSALGSLFQHIIADLKNSSPIWEDFLFKATKLHSQLKSTLLTSTSFLDSFQKIADMATNTRGATKEIGSALTRLCLRQRSVEARLKTFANSLLESLVLPLQEKLEDWKKIANNLDKEHTKEYKRAKQELKKKSSDTLKLQKKVRKVGVCDIRRTLDYALQDVTDKYLLLEETEKQSVRKALIEERSHFCIFVGYLQPVLESELTMLQEINHLQEIVDTLSRLTGNPHLLPSASEQVISDVKGSDNTWSFKTPPSSPGSLGSRKSSVCSISSINSSSSGSLKSHSSHSKQLSHCQSTLGSHHLASVSSQDSGFTSQDTLYMNVPVSSLEMVHQLSTFAEHGSTTLSTPSSPVPSVTSTWPNLQDTVQYEKQPNYLLKYQRPHTISSAYEKANHNRPAITAHTFQPLDHGLDVKTEYPNMEVLKSSSNQFREYRSYSSQPGTPIYSKPSIPERNEDMMKRKPSVPEKSASVKAKHVQTLLQYGAPNKSLPDFNKTPPDQVVPHPVYANTAELASKIGIRNDIEEFNPYNLEDNKESRKDLASVLNESLLLQSARSNDMMPPNMPARPKHFRPVIGGSETLPRSRGSICEENITEWHLYSQTFNNNINICQSGIQRRPASVAGFSSGFPLPRKASTLQRVGSSNNKPPTPVRRSSSITASSVQSRSTNENFSLKGNPCSNSISSGAGEVQYSPNLTELYKNTSTGNSPQEKVSYPLNNISAYSSSKDYESSSDMFSVNGTTNSESKNSIVTDVSDSRARLIHDLNSTLQHQRKIQERRVSQAEAPLVPPRHSSQQDPGRVINQNIRQSHATDNIHYGSCNDQELLIQSPNTKIATRQSISKQLQRKPSVPESFTCKDSNVSIKETSRTLLRRASQPTLPMTLTAQVNELPGDEKSLKQCFLAALNAKLAQQQHQQKSTDEEKHHSLQKWQMRDNRSPVAQVSNWVAEKQLMQPQLCRESLMDQIRRGTTLRKVASNDRSAPRLS